MVTPSVRHIILFRPISSAMYRQGEVPVQLLAIARMFLPAYDVRIISAELGLVRQTDDEVRHNIEAHLDNCLFFGVTVMTGYGLYQALAMTRFVRERAPAVKIVWGGWHASLLPEKTLEQSGADFVVIGQGEYTITELADALERGESDFFSIKGLAWKQGDRIVLNQARPSADLNALPPMPYHLLDDCAFEQIRNVRSAGMYTSIGCPFRCGFCADAAVYGSKWRGISLERASEEMRRLRDEHGVQVIRILDSNFFADWDRGVAILQAMRQWGLRAQFVNARVETLLRAKQEHLPLFRDTVDFFLVGAESGDDDLLASINKHQTVDSIKQLAAVFTENGIAINFSFLVGLPFKTETVQKEMQVFYDMADEILTKSRFLHRVQIHVYTPYPGTPLFENAVQLGFSPPTQIEDWAKMELFATKLPYLPRHFADRIEFITTFVLQLTRPDYRFYQGNNRLLGAFFAIIQAMFQLSANFRWRHKFFSWPVEFRLVKMLLSRH